MSKFGKKQIKIVSEIMRINSHMAQRTSQNETKLMLTTYKQNYINLNTVSAQSAWDEGKTFIESQKTIYPQKLTITGPLGTQSIFIPNLFEIKLDNKNLSTASLSIIPRENENSLIIKVGSGLRSNIKSGYITETKNKVIKKRNQLWGTLWSQINKMIKGVTIGFKRQIKLTGIGFKATLSCAPSEGSKDKNYPQILSLNLGYSHPIIFNVPKNIIVIAKGNQGTLLELTSSDEIKLSNFAHTIKKVRPADKSFGNSTGQSGKEQTGIIVINI